MGKINEKIKELRGQFVPMSAVAPTVKGKFVFDADEVAAFTPDDYEPGDVPRGIFKSSSKEYNVSFLAAASQMLLKDKTKVADVKKLKKSVDLFRNSDKFQSVRDYVKSQDSKKEKELTDIAFECVANVPVLDSEGNQTYPPSQYNGADEYADAIALIRQDTSMDTQTRTNAYRKARKALYLSGTIDAKLLDKSLAIKYPVFVVA